MARLVYRLVYHDPPSRDDFLSDEEMGAPAAPHETAEDRTGMSTWGKLREARGLARWQVRTGKRAYAAIAEIAVEDGGPFRVRDSPPPRDHCTLWGDPDALTAAARVVEHYPE
jgi:hypothetical protein